MPGSLTLTQASDKVATFTKYKLQICCYSKVLTTLLMYLVVLMDNI